MKGDLTLVLLVFCLAIANIWILFVQKKDDSRPKKMCKKSVITSEHQARREASTQCPVQPSQPSPLPAKCVSRLQPLVMEQGLVAGQPKGDKVFLTIGVPSWKGRTDELRTTLTSLFSHVTAEDANDLLVVVSCGGKSRQDVTKLITSEFATQLNKGYLQVVSPTEEFLKVLAKPASLGLRNFGKSVTPTFVHDVKEFNSHFIFLLEYCQRLSEFYLQLADQIVTLDRFLPTVRKESGLLKRDFTKSGLHFSEEHFMSCGRLLQSKPTMEEIAEYGLTFGPAILPMDVIDGWRSLRVSRGAIHYSDKRFFALAPKRTSDRPPANIKTDLELQGKRDANLMYNNKPGYFWSSTPKQGNFIKITLETPAYLKRILIESGTPFFGDYADGMYVSVCPQIKGTTTCSIECQELAVFGDPVQDMTDLAKSVKFPVKCIKMDVKLDAERWLVIRDVAVWVDKDRKI